MAEWVSSLRKVLNTLKFPVKETDLQKLYLKYVRDMPESVQIEQCSALTAAFEEAVEVNTTHVRAMLHDAAPRIIEGERKRIPFPVQFEHIVALKTRVEILLKKEAKKYIKVTFENAERVNLDKIAAVEVRLAVPTILHEREDFAAFVTAAAVSDIYLLCQSYFLSLTQSQLLALRSSGLLRPTLESYYGYLLDLQRVNSLLEVKLTKRICKEHFKYLRQEVERIFLASVTACVSGKPADWDIDPQSQKGGCMLFVASTAHALRASDHFANECLPYVIAWERYPTGQPADSSWEVLIECLSRLYIGLLRLQDVTDDTKVLFTHPEVYLWMQRVLAKVYDFPRKTAYYENRFLNTMNSCVAKVLKARSAFHTNFRYVLRENERVANSIHDPEFLKKLKDGVEFRYLTSVSIGSMLHISGFKGWNELDKCMVTTNLDVSGDVLLWKGKKTRVYKQNVKSSCLVAIPSTLLMGWGMLAPLFAQAMAEYFLDKRSALRKNLEKAKNVGVFLGLLLVHRHIKNKFQSLFGLGIGAQIVLSCLAEVAEYNRKVPEPQHIYILDVILFLGIAEVGDVDWDLVTEPVKGRFINLYSSRDAFFDSIIGPDMRQPVGYFGVQRDGVENRDMADVMKVEKMRRKGKDVSLFKVISKLTDYYQ